MSELTENGVSTTRAAGEFRCERYYSAVQHGWRWQWDYRDTTGRLWSGVAKTVFQARQAASRWSGEEVKETHE